MILDPCANPGFDQVTQKSGVWSMGGPKLQFLLKKEAHLVFRRFLWRTGHTTRKQIQVGPALSECAYINGNWTSSDIFSKAHTAVSIPAVLFCTLHSKLPWSFFFFTLILFVRIKRDPPVSGQLFPPSGKPPASACAITQRGGSIKEQEDLLKLFEQEAFNFSLSAHAPTMLVSKSGKSTQTGALR